MRSGSAQRVDGHTERGTAEREAEADPQGIAGAGGEIRRRRRGEMGEDGCNHERGDRPQEFDDREHALQAVRLQREARDEQCWCHRRAERQARQCRAEQDKWLAGRNSDAEHHDSRREQRHADKWEVVHGASGDDDPEHHRHDDGTAEFGQVEQPDADRAVGLQQHVGGEGCRGHRGRGGEQGDPDTGDRDRAGQHGADGQQWTPRPELVDDQRHDQRQTAQHRHAHGGVAESVTGQLCGPDERRRAADRRQCDCRQVTRGVEICRRGVVERQRGQHQSHERDRGDDPEQRSPRVRLGLHTADERADGDRAEHTHVHDHGGVAELGFGIADRQRRCGGDQHHAGRQALQYVSADVHARVLRRRGEHRPGDEQHRVAEQHPALRKVLGELDRQHRTDGIGRVAQTRTQAHRLSAHVQLLGDDRDQRVERRRQRQIRDEGEGDHRGDRRVTTGERALAHQRRLSMSVRSVRRRAASRRWVNGMEAGTCADNTFGAGLFPHTAVIVLPSRAGAPMAASRRRSPSIAARHTR